MTQSAYCLFETTLGVCGIGWRGQAVSFLNFPEATADQTEARIATLTGASGPSAASSAVKKVIRLISMHLEGKTQEFQEVLLDLDGSPPFAKKVYDAARKIPTGETRSYAQLAETLGHPKAARAVGNALRNNPVGLIIPCHRVLGAGGKPGGFSAHGGLATKARLLAIEGVTFGPPTLLRSPRDIQRAANLLKKQDPQLARCMTGPIPFRVQPTQSPYQTLFSAIVHQQLAPRAAATILERIKAIHSEGTIPEPAVLLDTPDRLLREAGLSASKTAAVQDLAVKTLDGTVPSSTDIVKLRDEEIINRLTSIYGIGRWTVQMLLIFNLGRVDVLAVDDFALRARAGDLYGMKQPPTPKQLLQMGELWRPYRTVASLYLWNWKKQ